MPSSPCLEPRCSGFAVYRGRCEQHAPARERETHHGHRRSSTGKAGRIYSRRRWHILRIRKLAADPVCEECEAELGTEVDHIVPVEEGGEPWAWANLRSLCSRCHGRKTAGEVRARVHE